MNTYASGNEQLIDQYLDELQGIEQQLDFAEADVEALRDMAAARKAWLVDLMIETGGD